MSDSEMVVLVHVEEAHGLFLRKEKVFITASLGGLTLQTEAVAPSQNTIFDFNIIWDTDKKAIKRMKTANLPIKLECFSTDGTVRHPIGFAIIPIRGVPVVSGENRQKLMKAVPKWHKLIGVASDCKALNPEVSVYCTITEPENVRHLDLQRDLKSYKFTSTSNLLSSQNGLFVEHNEAENYIQLGKGPADVQKFAVHINLGSIKGLNKKIDEHDQYHVQYMLFGTPSEDRVLVPVDDEDQFSLEEKITINFRASLETIRVYFNSVFFIPIEMFCNKTIIGITKFSLDLPVLYEPTQTQVLVHEVSGECLFSNPPGTSVLYEFYINRLSAIDPPLNTLSAIRLNIDNDVIASGVGKMHSDRSLHSDRSVLTDISKSTRLELEPEYYSPEHRMVTDIDDTRVESRIVSSRQYEAPTKIPQKTFSYTIILGTVEFCRKMDAGILQISLQHPRAHTTITISNVSVREEASKTLRNIVLVLYFSAKPNEILEIIESEACVLNIKGPHGFLVTAKLDNGTLLDQQDQIGIILMENESCEKSAIIQAHAMLEDLGTNLNACQQTENQSVGVNPLQKPHLDEELAYKMVEELEAWKTLQQDTFMLELKQREVAHMNQLTSEWTKRRTELEHELTHKLDQCNLLTVALEDANQMVKKSQEDNAINHRRFYESTIEKERTLRLQILRLQEEVRSTKIDSEHALKVAHLKYDDSCHKFDSLEQVHGHCRRFIADLEKELATLRMRSDEHDAMAELVDEMKTKLSREESSKLFFKQKWNETRLELESLRLRTISCDDEENDASLTQAIISEKAHLANEQQELQSIYEALEHI